MKMQLFGGFSLSNETISISEKSLHSNKLVRLLVYIVLHRDRSLNHQELIDTFWEDDRSKNPAGALKNLVYRLRTELKQLEEQELILTFSGAYQWNPDFMVEVDCEVFEKLAKRARSETDPVRRQALCEAAMKLYDRNVPASLAMESWMISILTYYRLLYQETAKYLAKIYAQEQEWDLLEGMCRTVLAEDNLDEDMHYWLIKSQVGKKNYEQAMGYYESAKHCFYDNLGIRESGRFDQIYDEILALTDNAPAHMDDVLNSVNENQTPNQAFVCEYPVFREIYRMEARRAKRTGIPEYVLLITLRKQGKDSSDVMDSRIRTGMQILENILRSTLRIGDVTARYSSTQYVLLLSTCTYESALAVAERLQNKFRSEAGKRRLTLQFEIEELHDVEAWNGR